MADRPPSRQPPPAPSGRTDAFAPPGEGTWLHDADHQSGVVSAALAVELPAAARDGLAAGFGRYGAGLSHLEIRTVCGHVYARMVPADPVTVAAREPVAAEALSGRRWASEVAGWWAVERPAAVSTLRDLSEVRPDRLDDDGLAGHLERLVGVFRTMFTRHFELHVPHWAGLGMLLVAATEVGVDPGEVIGALAGASAGSRAVVDELDAVAGALDAAGAPPVGTDGDVVSVPGAVGPWSRLVADHGPRLLGVADITGVTHGEVPGLLARAVQARRDADRRGADRDAVSAVRELFGAADRDRLTTVIDDGVAAYGLRDDQSAIHAAWPGGLARLAMVEAGRRLADRVLLEDPADVFALEPPEVARALTAGVTPAHLEDRLADRAAWAAAVPPPFLGPPPGPPPEMPLPPSVARITAAVGAPFAMGGRDGPPVPGRGLGVGDRAHTGRAVVAVDVTDALARIRPGDVLVCRSTTPAWGAVLVQCGALVTDAGDRLCHAAIVARELGIPALVGVAGATATVPDGATVTVDPAGGVLTVH